MLRWTTKLEKWLPNYAEADWINNIMYMNQIDIKENYIYHLGNELLAILLKDHSSGQNIIWATDNYSSRGLGYQGCDQITIQSITGHKGSIVKPRTEKSKKEQADRIRHKAEVFTPSWICNKQNNLVDNAWFGVENVFNTEVDKGWVATSVPIAFPTATKRTWTNYVVSVRLEIACGEAPYLASRYDTVTGESIELTQRIGMLDRKLRVVTENTRSESEWVKWATRACKSIYGYDWQGDNVLLARENLLFTFQDYYAMAFGKEPSVSVLRKIAEILSWNIWQMDGLKYVIPDSCKETEEQQLTLFGRESKKQPCEGCAKNDPFKHTGIYCKIKDWKENKNVLFVSLLKN
jgi:hypothetical protein